jgi:hypothetical protein
MTKETRAPAAAARAAVRDRALAGTLVLSHGSANRSSALFMSQILCRGWTGKPDRHVGTFFRRFTPAGFFTPKPPTGEFG